MISGIYTAVLLLTFLAIVFWAWSSNNKKKFDEMAQLPLQDETSSKNNEEVNHE